MQKTDANQKATNAHRRAQTSTTLNRRYVRRPSSNTMTMAQQKTMLSHRNAPVMKTQMKQQRKTMIKVSDEEDMMMATQRAEMAKKQAMMRAQQQRMQQQRMQQAQQEKAQSSQAHPMQKSARAKMREQRMAHRMQKQAKKASAKEMKDQAIQKALTSASNTPTMAEQITKGQKTKKTKTKMRFGFGRVMIALSCAAAVVFAIAYFVNLNMPDISLRVAAMQTGINASYPSYVPRDYSITSITSEEGKVTLEFTNNIANKKFVLIEEASSWDSNALLTNYVKEEYHDNYTIIREQGLTIYVSDSDAAWVNGGVVYKIKAESETLTNKQIRSIAVSL